VEFSMLVEWADKIDSRSGPISGRDADALEALLRRTAKDCQDQDMAIRDAISETARCADELAFWRYQAIWHRALMLYGKPGPGQTLLLEDSRVWKEAEKQLEEQRVQERRERYAHAEASRDPGGT
jgi:hypothetical protein